MKLGSREKYQPIQYCWVHISRLLGYLVSYMPFAYRYPTDLLQRADRTAFALAALMLSCLHAVTIDVMCSYCVLYVCVTCTYCVAWYLQYLCMNLCRCVCVDVCRFIVIACVITGVSGRD